MALLACAAAWLVKGVVQAAWHALRPPAPPHHLMTPLPGLQCQHAAAPLLGLLWHGLLVWCALLLLLLLGRRLIPLACWRACRVGPLLLLLLHDL